MRAGGDEAGGDGGPGLRRAPTSRRGRATVARVLDAVDCLVAAEGVEAVSTTAVAERAGVAVGTLYQYVDDADGLVVAALERHAGAFAEALADALEGRPMRRKRDAANAALDAFIGYCRQRPAFVALWQAAPGEGLAGERAEDLLVGVVTGALVDRGLVAADDPAYALEARVQWAVALGLVRLAFRLDPVGDEAVLAHLRRLFDLDVRTT